ncbi:ABC transporter ATP-binding protein [Frankia sp. CiP1_Cm_nod1]|uniref:ABC transporter ATP-binding protein n=1 Tax=Frankia sp. CiP1_Cm_nod1 TaxID=2897160 RepID=UPI004043DE8F
MATDIQRNVTTLPGQEADLEPVRPPAAGPLSAPDGIPLAVTVRGLRRAFGGNVVIDDLDLDVPAGQFVALLGASGCGKSTLLRILADLDTEISGQVRVASRRAVAFQAPRLLPWKRVWRNVVLGLPGRPDRARAAAALTEVGLAHRADAWPKTLSGGEAQRVSLARALVRDPDLMLLDEPFGALDALTRIRAQGLVEQLWQRHSPAVLLVTHDVEEALLLADRVLVMKDGVIAHSTAVTLARPRDVGDPCFVALRAELLGWLGVGYARSEAADDRPARDGEPGPAADIREPAPRQKILS